MPQYSCTNCGATEVPDPTESQCCCPGGPSFTSNIKGGGQNSKKPKPLVNCYDTDHSRWGTCNQAQLEQQRKQQKEQNERQQQQCIRNLQILPAINYDVSKTGVSFDLDPSKKRLGEFAQRLKKPRVEQHAPCCTRCGCRRCRCPMGPSYHAYVHQQQKDFVQKNGGGDATTGSAPPWTNIPRCSYDNDDGTYAYLVRNVRGHLRPRNKHRDCPWSNFCAPHDWPTHVMNSHRVNTTSITPEQAKKNLELCAHTVRQEYNNIVVPWVRQTPNVQRYITKKAFGRNHIPNPECIELRQQRRDKAYEIAHNLVNSTRVRLQLSGWEEAVMRQQQPSLFRRKLQQYIESATQKGWLGKWREGGREEWKELLQRRLKTDLHVRVPVYPKYVSKRIGGGADDTATAEEIEQMLKDDDTKMRQPEKLMPGPAEAQFGYSDGPPQM